MTIQPLEKNARLQNVLYIVPKFPVTSMTFVLNEMDGLRQQGVKIVIAPVQVAQETFIHDLERSFADNVIYIKLLNYRLWWDAISVLSRNSMRRLGLTLLREHLQSPSLLGKLVVAWLKGVYLGKWCQAHGIEHIHAQFLTTATTTALIASTVSNIPYTATGHAFDIYISNNMQLKNAAIPLKCLRASAVVMISDYNLRYMLTHYPKLDKANLVVIYNGINVDLFTPAAPQASQIKAQWTILSNGRLVEKKGHHVLICAVAELRRRGRSVVLDIIGDGPMLGILQETAESEGVASSVTFLGRLSQEDVVKHYHTSDIFALACIPEANGNADGLPTVLIELLAAELPTVSTTVTGIPEIVQHMKTGLCVAPNDVTALADALAWCMDNPEDAHRLAVQGRALVLEKFDRMKNSQRLYELWQHIHSPMNL